MTLAADVFYIDKIAFLLTKVRKIKFATAQHLVRQDTSTLFQSIKQVCGMYDTGGFRVRLLLGDRQFEALRPQLVSIGVDLNTVSALEHVPEAERATRTLKEHVRGAISNTPFTRFPPRMVIECVSGCNLWNNSFSPHDGVHRSLAPRTIVTGRTIASGPVMEQEIGMYV